MQSNERFDDPEEAARHEADGRQANMWTSLPAIVDEHDVEHHTIKARSAIKLQHIKPDGSLEWIEMPQFADVPLQYPSGGGATMTLPLKAGDEVLLNFSSRSIDNWFAKGGVQEQPELRMHSHADGFAIPGFRNQKRLLKDVDPDAMEMRTDDGNTKISFNPKTKVITITAENPVQIKGDIHVTGNIAVDGNIVATGEVTGKDVRLSTHVHSGVLTGGGNTKKPVPGT